MKFQRSLIYFFAVCFFAALQAHAVVTRDDVPDSQYIISGNDVPVLVDLPGEGHGVLIGSKWVVTAAHATQGYALRQVSINGKDRAVAELILHPLFAGVPHLPTSGDAGPLMASLAELNDIALIKLKEPVDDVTPAKLYRNMDELGKTVIIFGKGATGNGRQGQYPNSPHRGELRRAYNKIIAVNAKWIDYKFNCDGMKLEGVLGDGDSGGPVMIQEDGEWKLAGLASWKHWVGDISDFRAGVCGQLFSNARISYYAAWIDKVISSQ
jgi:hypothetical protein